LRAGYLLISLFFLSLFIVPHDGEGEAIFAYNLHNLGRFFERVVQLQEGRDGMFGPIGSEHKNYYLRVF
jgi:hypothetical protein